MKLIGAAILVSRGIKVLQAAPAAYRYRSASEIWMDRKAVTEFVERELRCIGDPAVLALIQQLRIEPHLVEREWDYGHGPRA